MLRLNRRFLKLFLLFSIRLWLCLLQAFSPKSFERLHRRSLVKGHLIHFLDLLLSGRKVQLVNLLEFLHLSSYHFSLNLIPDPLLAAWLRLGGADPLPDKVVKGGGQFRDLLLHG